MNDEINRSEKSEQTKNRLGDYIDFVRNTIKRLAPTGQKRWTTPEALEEELKESYFATAYRDFGYPTFDAFLRDAKFEDFWVVEKDAEGKDAVRIRLRREIAQYLKGVTDTIAALFEQNGAKPIDIEQLNEALRGKNFAVTYTDLGYSSFEVFLTDTKRFGKFWNSQKRSDFSILLYPAGVKVSPEKMEEAPRTEVAAPKQEDNVLSPEAAEIAHKVESMGRLLFDAEGWVPIAKMEARIRAGEQLKAIGFESLQGFVNAFATQLGWETSLRGTEQTPSLRITEEKLKATPRVRRPDKRESRPNRNSAEERFHAPEQQKEPVKQARKRVGCGKSSFGELSDFGELSIEADLLRDLMARLAPQYATLFPADEQLELYLRFCLTLFFHRLYDADKLTPEEDKMLFNTGLLDRDNREIVAVAAKGTPTESGLACFLHEFRCIDEAHGANVPEDGKRFFLLADNKLTTEQILLSNLPELTKEDFLPIVPAGRDALEHPDHIETLCSINPCADERGNVTLSGEVALAYEAKRNAIRTEAPALYPLMYDVKAEAFYTLMPITIQGARYFLALAHEGSWQPVALCTPEAALMRSAPLSMPQKEW